MREIASDISSLSSECYSPAYSVTAKEIARDTYAASTTDIPLPPPWRVSPAMGRERERERPIHI